MSHTATGEKKHYGETSHFAEGRPGLSKAPSRKAGDFPDKTMRPAGKHGAESYRRHGKGTQPFEPSPVRLLIASAGVACTLMLR
jgi:hypothetical protein